MRRAQRALWIVIAVLSLPFCLYFVRTDWWSALRSQTGDRIYGRTISNMETQRYYRLCEVAMEIGLFDLLQDTAGNATSREEAYQQFMINVIILRHESERLGIEPSTAEIATALRALPIFQGANGFDLERYTQFTSTALGSRGFSETEIEELVADQLRVRKLKDLIGVGVQIPEMESRETFERLYGKLDVTVVRLRSEDLLKDVNISDAEISQYYETHKAQLKSEEKRKVDFVSFALSEEQKKLQGKERVEALQKLANRANDFEQALLEKGADFRQVAAKFQLPVDTTGEFTAANPDPKLKASPQLSQYAFQLNAQEMTSDTIQVNDGFYILHLNAAVEARPLTLEVAKPKIVTALREQRARELASNKGGQLVHQLREEMSKGVPLDVVIRNSGMKAEDVPPFALSEDPPANEKQKEKEKKPGTPDLQTIKGAVADLNPGDVSEFLPTENGGLIAILKKREPLDMAALADKKKLFEAQFAERKRRIAYFEWLRERQHEANVQIVLRNVRRAS